MSVTVTVNGEGRDLGPGATVATLVEALGIEARGVAVAVDGEVVPRRTWAAHALAGGEHVEVLTIAQGG